MNVSPKHFGEMFKFGEEFFFVKSDSLWNLYHAYNLKKNPLNEFKNTFHSADGL